MNDVVEGIILKQQDYRDKDVLLTVLTKEYGKLTFVGQGIRKLTSKNAGSLLSCTIAQLHFDYHAGKTMFRLKTARTMTLFRKSHQDLEKSLATGFACELSDVLAIQGFDETSELFDLLKETLQCIENEEMDITVLTLFTIACMDLFGISADVDECVHCGKKNVVAFSSKQGGFLCKECAALFMEPSQSISDLRRMRLLVKGGMENISIIQQAGGAEFQDLERLVEMLREHAGLKLKSFTLLQRLANY